MLQIAIIGIITAGLAVLRSSCYGTQYSASSSQPATRRNHLTRYILLTHPLHCGDKFDFNTPPPAHHSN